mmetsp:Transcript_28896/g.81375  ORF Transcript_28896/g.81375 Transcript_28896/m.81375 type:complete len:240 (-) Transcript_28896:119-838(-)|eukprot:CAMPEP_0117653804 /NCGR_PEP_ID=MMETSP0804-20121206/3395_1 /TAXON_ID=1074897 /ORGANISM="Tetraselmis astigmatica, Strain CCMP880" /LENGTH=239 /DNA_ID=CAMNT_0005460021 /DNA_START=256 /DNA_END=975 /DNA_ORIENTATION=+
MTDVTVAPLELKFRFELRKQIPVTLTLTNNAEKPVGFKVKTTAPKKYIVRPSTGVIGGNGRIDIQVIMQAQKEAPADIVNCKDKFLVQTVELEPTEDGAPELPPAVFEKGFEGVKSETKLKVVLMAPPAPPSPVPEGEEPPEGALSRAISPAGEQERLPSVLDDLAAATKEANQLKAQVKSLTDQRDTLTEKLHMLELKSQGKPLAMDGGAATAVSSTGITLIHLVLTAIICFLLGHYT